MTIPLQNYVDLSGPVVSAGWLNQVDVMRYTILAEAATKAAARAALTSDAALEVANGGTGTRTGQLIPTGDNVQTLGSATNAYAQLYLGAGHAPVLDTVVGAVGYNPQSAAEAAVPITPSSYSADYGNTNRYGVDVTGVADSTAAFQVAINSAWSMFNYVDGQGLWNGGGGAVPITTVHPGKYKLSGTTVLPTGMTFQGQAHPANTTSHTRLIMNSTGTTPARTWSALTVMPNYASIQQLVSGTLYWFRANSTGGTTGSSAPAWPTSGTVVDGTVTWTNMGVCTSTDNRNTPMFKFSRANKLGGTSLMNQSIDMTIQNLEFWAVTLSNDFNNPLGGNGISQGDYPLGGIFYIDCDVTDTRIKNCCFQNNPCGLNIQNAKSGTTASDGFVNTSGVNMWVEECEFDAAACHVYAYNSSLNMVFRNCDFYGGVHLYKSCTGKVRYENCRFFGNAYIDASDSGNSFSVFAMVDCYVEQPGGIAYPYVSVYGAKLLDIKNSMFQGATGYSTVVATSCTGGMIHGNTIDNSGYNSASTTGINAVAAIKCVDCTNLKVSDNNITATSAASYNGFGILTLVNVGSSKVFVTGNAVSAPYNGATYNNQTRVINLATTADILGVNWNANTGVIAREGAVAKRRIGVTYSTSMTIDAAAGDLFKITVTDAVAFTMNAPTNASEGQFIVIHFRNTSGGSIGTITWNAIFKLYSGAIAPGSGGSMCICFQFDNTNWVEMWRTANSIPN